MRRPLAQNPGIVSALIYVSQFISTSLILRVTTGVTTGPNQTQKLEHKKENRLGAHKRVLFHRSSSVLMKVCSQGLLGDVSKHFKDLRTSRALLLPRVSSSKRCRTGIISTSRGNNMIINTYFMCSWKESSSRWHLVPSCSFENHTSAAAAKETSGSESLVKG